MNNHKSQDIQIYESNMRLHIVPDERPNVIKVHIQRVVWNPEISLTTPRYVTVKSFRMTVSQTETFLESVKLLASKHWRK